jgi:hypothetical protein
MRPRIDIENRETKFWMKGEIPRGMGEINQTLQWYPSDTEENYHSRGNKFWGPNDITYVNNAHGYRSMEIDLSSTKKKIMFLGCSFTHGTGLPCEDTWPIRLTQKLSKHIGEEIEPHNFGVPASGSDLMVSIAHQVIPVLKPDLVIAMFTSISRRSVYTSWGVRRPFLANFSDTSQDEQNLYKAFIQMSFESNDFYAWCRDHAFIHAAAARAGTVMLWGFSHRNDIMHIEDGVLCDYVCMKNHMGLGFEEYNHPDLLARDGGHPGLDANEKLADRWFKKIVTTPSMIGA